jgi:hypothetical protein
MDPDSGSVPTELRIHSLLVGAVAALSGGPSFLAIMLSARTSACDSENAVSLADQCARCFDDSDRDLFQTTSSRQST